MKLSHEMKSIACTKRKIFTKKNPREGGRWANLPSPTPGRIRL